MIIVGILLGLFVLVLLVVIHELGHAIVAKRNGVIVEEFGIGFPPAAKKWKVKKSFLGDDVIFSLNWLPLGGFVRLKGEYDAARGEGTYGQATFWVKTKILLAGVFMNWLAAIVLFTVLALVGMPKILSNQVTLPFDTQIERSPLIVAQVTKDSPAAAAGLKSGDRITKVGGVVVETPAELSAATKSYAGQMVEVFYIREGNEQTVSVKIHTEEQAKQRGYLGVSSSQSEKVRATYSAPVLAVATTGQLTYETLKGVGTVITKAVGGFWGQFFGSESAKQTARSNLAAASEGVVGPLGILGVLFPSVLSAGWLQIILLAAIISLTLAVMNILPIPALDGGRWFTMAIFRLLRKSLTKEREEIIQTVGFLILMGLTILVTWSDIVRLLKG